MKRFAVVLFAAVFVAQPAFAAIGSALGPAPHERSSAGWRLAQVSTGQCAAFSKARRCKARYDFGTKTCVCIG